MTGSDTSQGFRRRVAGVYGVFVSAVALGFGFLVALGPGTLVLCIVAGLASAIGTPFVLDDLFQGVRVRVRVVEGVHDRRC